MPKLPSSRRRASRSWPGIGRISNLVLSETSPTRNGWGAFDGEPHEILDAPFRQHDIEHDAPRLHALRPDDPAARLHGRAAEGGAHGLEEGVAAGAIDDGFKPGGEGHGVAAREAELRRAGLAMDADAAEDSIERAGGIEDAGDRLEDAEVGIAEDVLSRDRRLTGILFVPGSKIAGDVDDAAGQGIGQDRLVLHRLAGSGAMQREVVDLEDARQLLPVEWDHAEVGAIGVDGVDDDGRRAALGLRILRRRLRGRGGRDARLLGRDVDLQLVQADLVDVVRRVPDGPQRGLHGEGVGGEERREVLAAAEGKLETVAADHQAGGPRLPRRQEAHRDVQRVQLDTRAEALLQVGNGLFSNIRLEPLGGAPAGERQDEDDESERNCAPNEPLAHEGPVRRVRETTVGAQTSGVRLRALAVDQSALAGEAPAIPA